MGINTKGLKKAEICKEMEKLLTLPKKPNIPYEFKYDPDDDLYDIGEQLRLGYLTKEEAQDMVDEGWYKTLTYKGMLFQNKRMPYDGLSDDELRQEGMIQSTDFLWYYDVIKCLYLSPIIIPSMIMKMTTRIMMINTMNLCIYQNCLKMIHLKDFIICMSFLNKLSIRIRIKVILGIKYLIPRMMIIFHKN